jgi:ribonuclease HII
MKEASTQPNAPVDYPAKEGFGADSMLKYEQEYLQNGYDFVIGIDEAGRGPLAGPVVASACALRVPSPIPMSTSGHPLPWGEEDMTSFSLVRDSKKLSEKQREKLFDFIHEHFYVGVGICDHRTIDRINVLEATFLAMKKAVSSLKSNIKTQNAKVQSKNQKLNNDTNYQLQDTRYIILVDGNKPIPNLSMEQQVIVNGDKLVKSISAASIVAKVTRDRIMLEMHENYPQYCFNQHKGYGTACHMEMIKKYGVCEIHRKSFEPIKSWTKGQEVARMTAGLY